MSRKHGDGGSLVKMVKRHAPALTIAAAVVLILGPLIYYTTSQSGPAKAFLPDQSLKSRCQQANSTMDEIDKTKLSNYDMLYKKWEGWMDEDTKIITQWLMALQLRNCIIGSIGEIGIYHGKYFFTMAVNSLPYEAKVAVDLFDDQTENIDRSGITDTNLTAAVLENAQNLGYSAREISLIKANSLSLTPKDFKSLGIHAFRFFSVDGGHHFDAVQHDLLLARSLILPSGIVAVNDFWNRGWMGVMDATLAVIHKGELAPFLTSGNKLFLCTPDFHSFYYKHVTSHEQYKCRDHSHYSQQSIGGWSVCDSRILG